MVGSGTGLFSGDPHYGEMTYTLAGHRVTTRSTTAPIVLDLIYQIAGVTAPDRSGEAEYPGYPLRAAPGGITTWAMMVLLLWSVLVAGAWWYARRGTKTILSPCPCVRRAQRTEGSGGARHDLDEITVVRPDPSLRSG